MRRPKWSQVTIALAVIAALAIASPVFGISKSIKKAIKKEVSKQIAHAIGPAGTNGTNGAPGPPGNPGVNGNARAYGRVSSGGGLSRSKNVTAISHTATSGIYCITLGGGIDTSTTGLVATPDYSGDVTDFLPNGGQTIVEFRSNGADCGASQLEVRTGVRTVSTFGSADGDIRSVDNSAVDAAFFFVVP